MARQPRRQDVPDDELSCAQKAARWFEGTFTEAREYKGSKWFKVIVDLALGFGIGCAVWFIFFDRLYHKIVLEPLATVVQWVLIAAIAIIFAAIAKVRCTIALTIPVVICKHANTFLFTWSMYLLFYSGGPVHNTVRNFGGAGSMLLCNLVVAQNITWQRIMLQVNPLKDIVTDLAGGSAETKRQLSQLSSVMSPLERYINDQSDGKGNGSVDSETDYFRKRRDEVNRKAEAMMKQQREYDKEKARNVTTAEDEKWKSQLDKIPSPAARRFAEKFSYRCEDIYDSAQTNCVKFMHETHAQCHQYLKDEVWAVLSDVLSFIFCSIFKLTYFCNMMTMLVARNMDCHSSKLVNGTMDYADTFNLTSGSFKEVVKQFSTHINYELNLPHRPLHAKSLLEMLVKFTGLELVAKAFGLIVQTILAAILLFLLAWAMAEAYCYMKKYLEDIEYDNIYTTPYFWRLDKDRKLENDKRAEAEDEQPPLPQLGEADEERVLRYRHDRMRVSSVWAYELDASRFLPKLFLSIFPLLFLVTIWFLDFFMTHIWLIVRKYGDAEIDHSGYSEISFQVHGDGFMARMIRSMLYTFNHTSRLSGKMSNHHCRMNVSNFADDGREAVWWTYQALMMAATILILLLDCYFWRLRCFVCSIVFRKRQKQRIVWLYNDMIRKRATRLHTFTMQLVRRMMTTGEMDIKPPFTILRWLRENCCRKKVPLYCCICDDWLEYEEDVRARVVRLQLYNGDNNLPEPTPYELKKLRAKQSAVCQMRGMPANASPDHFYCKHCWDDMQTLPLYDFNEQKVVVLCNGCEKDLEKESDRTEMNPRQRGYCRCGLEVGIAVNNGFVCRDCSGDRTALNNGPPEICLVCRARKAAKAEIGQ